MLPKVYIETTIVSYLTARPSRDLIIAAHQQLTREWWENQRSEFGLFVSQAVIQESSAGDTEMSQRRLSVVEAIPSLELNNETMILARRLITDGPIPEKAATDALHISVSAVHGMDYLLTWNCKHIANAQMQNAVAAICRSEGYEPPVICTPEELSGE